MKRGVASYPMVGVDLGLKLQHDHNRPFYINHVGDNDDDGRRLMRRSKGDSNVNVNVNVDDHDGDGGGDGRGRGGPTCKGYNSTNTTTTTSSNNNNNNMMMSDIYDVAAASELVHSDAAATVNAGRSSVLRGGLQQPFDVSYPSPQHHPLYKSSAATMGFPFTAAQWKELERQAMIYKYMMASLPVPPDLLYSSFPSNLTPQSGYGPASYLMAKYASGLNLVKWSGNIKDAEPGRCKRTDGKKWRCSRDVAPNQKYCERHMHRGRPRSRKHVEPVQSQQQLNNNTTHSEFTLSNSNSKLTEDNPSKKTRPDVCNPQPVGSSFRPVTAPKASTFDHNMVPGANPYENSRNLWTEEQQWQHMMQANMSSPGFQHHLDGVPLNLNSHADIGLLERPFIDAWAPMGVATNKDNEGSNKACLASSRGHGNAMNGDMCQIHMGLGVSWVTSPSSPGGPLAEVLRPGASRSASDAGDGDFITPPATAVSSPSGVLQRTFASFSDSSGSNSPICHSSKANSDMPFQWLN